MCIFLQRVSYYFQRGQVGPSRDHRGPSDFCEALPGIFSKISPGSHFVRPGHAFRRHCLALTANCQCFCFTGRFLLALSSVGSEGKLPSETEHKWRRWVPRSFCFVVVFVVRFEVRNCNFPFCNRVSFSFAVSYFDSGRCLSASVRW